MLHFVISLFYLLLVYLLALGYIFLFTFCIRYILQVLKGLRRWQWSKTTFVPSMGLFFFFKPILTISVVFLITIGLYVFERNRWINADSAYKGSKEYLATGMVLADYRTLAIKLAYPERLIWKPLTILQQMISESGRKLLPPSDAEHAIWVYHFVLAPYINCFHAPHNKAVYPLIDASEYVLETLATKQMQDMELRNRNKYLIYPLVTLYYHFSYKGKYFVNPGERRYTEGYYKDPEQYSFLQRVAEWTIELENEWPKHPNVTEYMEENPDIHLIQLASTVLLLHELLYYQIHDLSFTCDNRYLNLYYEYMSRYLADDSPYHRVNRQMQKRLDHPVILHGARVNFFGHRLCNRPRLPGYNIRRAQALSSEGKGWYEAFVALNKKLVPREKQEENMTKYDSLE